MCVKVSDTVLQPITGLRITLGTYIQRLWAQWEDNSTHPSPSHTQPSTLQIGCLGHFSKLHATSRTSEGKHVRESLRHGVTTHNWFAHYLWDIYKGFGHNGKIIQRTLPPPILSRHPLQIGCLGQFSKLHATSRTSEGKHVRESLRHGVTTHKTGLRITFGTYTKALGTMGR